MAFYSEKGWYKSKTVWTGIISAIAGVLLLFGIVLPVDPATAAGWILVLVGIFTSVFRINATEKVVIAPSTT